MIDLYTWHTPNGRKVSIMLEEIGMTYNVFPINIAKDEQFQPHFLEVSPNNRIPAIVDKENNNYKINKTNLARHWEYTNSRHIRSRKCNCQNRECKNAISIPL